MKTVIQRVGRASVSVDGEVVGEIGPGLLVLLGVEVGDTTSDADALVDKISCLRLFPGKTPMDLSVRDVGGACLVVSQFTLSGSVRKGRRPSFSSAEAPDKAVALYEYFAGMLRGRGIPVETGRFGASMQVELVNDGPVTLLVNTHAGTIA
ncbi:MAG: D-tyrosyl-tRNA(Tyr) deacylase [Myxococcales bacterium FL481]|nr:MAG: D-tyrosyl-tRNA(Tyr) deacylase [Myxococcales bacterium FL481]